MQTGFQLEYAYEVSFASESAGEGRVKLAWDEKTQIAAISVSSGFPSMTTCFAF